MHLDADPVHSFYAVVEIVEVACDGPGAQQQSDLDERLSPFGHYGRAAAPAILGDQPEVRLWKIMGVSIDGRCDGHSQLPPW